MQLLLLHKTIFPQHLQCIDTMKKFFCFIYLTCLMLPTSAQGILSLDSCRALAVANNKELLISREKINAAHYRKKEAFTNYLPKISATGGYMRNQKEFSLLNDAQKGALGSVGTQVSGALQNGIQGMMTQYPQLAQNPQFMALVQSLGNIDIATPLNGLGQSLVDAFRTDTRNMYAGALTLTQPLYMGGKIRAYNKITRYAEELARQQHNSGMQEVILSTDQAYWQVVSLANKKKLAEGYLELLQKLESDIDKMIAEASGDQSGRTVGKSQSERSRNDTDKSKRRFEPFQNVAMPTMRIRPFHSRHSGRRAGRRPAPPPRPTTAALT